MKRRIVMINVKCVWFCSIFFRISQSHTIRSGFFGVFPVASLSSASENRHILQKYIDQTYPTLSPSCSPESISTSPPLSQETVDTSAALTLGDRNSTDSASKQSSSNFDVDEETINKYDTNSTTVVNDLNSVEISLAEEDILKNDVSNNSSCTLSSSSSSSSSTTTTTTTTTITTPTTTTTNTSISVEVNDGIYTDAEISGENDQLLEEKEKTINDNDDDDKSEDRTISLGAANAPVGTQDKGVSVDSVVQKYRGRVVVCHSVISPHIKIYLCGTLHVAQTSADMVRDVIRCVRPDFVMLELCEARIDNLMVIEHETTPANLTLTQVVRNSFEERSLKTFGMGLLTWMQLKAASVMGSKLGGELITAAKEAHSIGAAIVLGDRLYSVTIQRIFDRLRFIEKCKMIFVVIWESLTMSLFKIKDYIKKTEDDDNFVKGELERFAKHMPSFAEVIISERDEYLAQSLHQMAEVAHARRQAKRIVDGGDIVAVVGAGHLAGIQRHLAIGKSPIARIHEISASSKQPNTWPGDGVLHVVNTDILFSNNNDNK